MTDPKDTNLSPIGREWDNAPAPPSPWSLERAALYGLVASIAIFAINTMASETTVSADPIRLVVRLGMLPLLFVIGAAIRNLWVQAK